MLYYKTLAKKSVYGNVFVIETKGKTGHEANFLFYVRDFVMMFLVEMLCRTVI